MPDEDDDELPLPEFLLPALADAQVLFGTGMEDDAAWLQPGGWWWLAVDYKDAADFLVSGHLAKHHDLDSAVPVLFLYRHYLELALKALVYQLEKDPQKVDTHNLNMLWERVCRQWDLDPSRVPYAGVTAIVARWSTEDKTSQSFRYPTKKAEGGRKGEKTLSVNFTHASLSALREHMKAVHNALVLIDEEISFVGDACDES